MDKKTLGRRINAARKDRGLTSEKLAEACNINATYLRQIEAGTKVPSLPVFVTICTELKASPTYLLAGELGFDGDDTDDLIALCSKATPSQMRTITAMIRTALDTMTE